jgi:hypothetical protein
MTPLGADMSEPDENWRGDNKQLSANPEHKDARASLVEGKGLSPHKSRPNSQKTTLSSQLGGSNYEIERWQAGAGTEAEDEDVGIVARLLRACVDSLSYILLRYSTSTLRREKNILRRCLTTLKLWAKGHGVWDGKLDNILARSKNLHYTTLSIMNPLCKILTNGVVFR